MAANPNPYRITNELWWAWEQSQKAIPGVRYGGTYTRKRYYHSSVAENLANWAPNYSIRVPLDLNGGNKVKGRAMDLTMSDGEMRKRTRLLRDSALDPKDDRLNGMREFYGTLDGRTVFGLIKDDEDGPWRSASSDSSHLWHIHAAWFAAMIANQRALAGFVSVISGESLAQWRARPSLPGGGSIPTPILGGLMLPIRYGDKGEEDVQLVQLLLLKVGEKLPRYGADASFGDEMAAALRSFWKKIKPAESYDGKRVTAHVMFYLWDRAFGSGPADAQIAAAVADYLRTNPPALPASIQFAGGTLTGIKAK